MKGIPKYLDYKDAENLKLTATGSLGSTNSTDATPIGDWISPVMVGCNDNDNYFKSTFGRGRKWKYTGSLLLYLAKEDYSLKPSASL